MSEVSQNPHHEDEIDLFDLVDDVRDKWYWLVGSVLIGMVFAIAYAVTATPVYETEATIIEVPPSELLAFNQPALRTTLKLVNVSSDSDNKAENEPVFLSDEAVFELDPEGAFAGARSVIRSASTRKAFYGQLLESDDPELVGLMSSDGLTEEQNLSNFLKRFKFRESGAQESLDTYLTVQFELSRNPEIARDVLNSYVQYALDLHEKRIRNEFELKVQAELELNRTWAENFRNVYASDKERRIAKLEEAAEIAASIGQSRPFYNTNDVIVSSEPPLYMMGETALRQEAELLKNRASKKAEDVFVDGLSVINNYVSNLESVTVDWASVKLADIDQPALLPLRPIKPRKLLVVALGGVGGLMFGVLAALLAAASNRHLRRSERH